MTTAAVPHDGDNEAESSASSSSETFLWTRAVAARRRQRRRDTFQSHQTPPRTLTSANMTWLDKFRHSFHGNSEDDAKRLHGNSDDDDDDDDALASSSGDISWEESLRHDDNDIDIDRHDGNHEDDKKAHPESITTPRTSITTNSIWQKNRSDKARYNAKIMPNKLIMIRHGQSEGNVNEALYSTTPDNAMRLTQLGWDQARQAGQVLKQRVILTGEPVHFIVSPYVRTVETFHGIVSAWCDPKEFSHIRNRERRLKAWYGRLLELGLTWHEDPRIREQDFGNYQVPDNIRQAKQERHRFGPFFYRFAHGESASDVFDRVSTFLDSLWRSFDHNQAKYYVLVTHGISIRVLLARYFRYSIDQFSHLANPRNCEMIVLAHDGAGKLKLDGRFEILEEKEGENANSVRKVKGYIFHERLRVLPKEYVHKLNARISYDDPLTSMDDKEPTIHENGR
jgi:broad specificity phosphatase PhoE